jgi:hypothetical protein
MDTHVRTLGFLNIIYAVLGALGAFGAIALSGGLRELYASFDDPMMGMIVATMVVLHAITALPSLVGGLFVIRYHSWARVLLIITSALDTLTVPIGTLLGLYGLWVLLTPEVEPLFNDSPPPYVRGKSRPPGKATNFERVTGD